MHVTGSNLFGQWPFKSLLIQDFQRVHNDGKIRSRNFDYETATLVIINWSYNIYKDRGRFYVSGGWQGKENQLVQVDLPEDCNLEDTDYTLVGNDYNLFLVNKKTKILWIMNLEDGKVTKKIKFEIETPQSNATNDNDCIIKIIVTNNSMLCLTSRGNVYVGFLPCLLDTNHCVGKICDIECGYEHYILLSEAGRVYTWGNGRRLQLGHGDLTNQESPTEVEALAGIKITKIKAGGWHCLALSEFGDLYAWGLNDVGQLGITRGINSQNSKLEVQSYGLPTLVDLFVNNVTEVSINVKDIACGTRHSAIVLEDGSVWTTGNNKYGQLGFSPEAYPNVYGFKKSHFLSEIVTKVICGPWSTVINTNTYIFFSFKIQGCLSVKAVSKTQGSFCLSLFQLHFSIYFEPCFQESHVLTWGST